MKGRVVAAAALLSASAVLLAVAPVRPPLPPGQIPAGFTPIFDGKSTQGWHWSHTAHHGMTAQAVIEDGALMLKPHPFGQGGILLTDKTYKDFGDPEVVLPRTVAADPAAEPVTIEDKVVALLKG